MEKSDPNRKRLETIAQGLGALREEVVFVGGATVGLLITDPAAPPVRVTKDIDCIIEVATRSEYDHRIRGTLVQLGFKELIGEGIPLCSWQKSGIRLDIMPTNEELLGFSNRWYPSALLHANRIDLGTVTIRLVSPSYFLATKFEAFNGRGRKDYFGSHDMEDIITLLDGRPPIAEEVKKTGGQLKHYLVNQFILLIKDRRFLDALPGHLIDPGRESFVIERMRRIVSYYDEL